MARLSRSQGWFMAMGLRYAFNSRVFDNDDGDELAGFRRALQNKSRWGEMVTRLEPRSASIAKPHHHPHHQTAVGDKHLTSTILEWSLLDTACRSAVIDQGLFEEALSQEQYVTFGTLAMGETPRMRSESAVCSPLTCLRRLFTLKNTIPLLYYLEHANVHGVFDETTYDGAQHFDPDEIEQNRAHCYPFPMYDVAQWRINQLEVPQYVFDNISVVPVSEYVIWEAVIALFISTYRVLQAGCHQYTRECVYDSITDTWSVPPVSGGPSLPPNDIFCVDMLKTASTYRIPIPVSLRELVLRKASPRIDVRDLFAQGHSLLATTLYRLFHFHRLMFTGRGIDDRCMLHQTQGMIDSHIPLMNMITEHCAFTDAALCTPIPRINEPAYKWPQRTAKHPLSPAALSEYSGVLAETTAHPAVFSRSEIPHVFMVWPSSTRWAVTLEESPHLMGALGQLGYLFRYSHEHTAIQNWDDPKTAFITLFISKMGMFRSFKRGDFRKAAECFDRHPMFATMMLYYLHLVQLGNIPGVMKRPSFFTRMRLWCSYRTNPKHARDPDWVVMHCFHRYRHAMRWAMHEIITFYMRLVPGMRSTLLQHPHQGIMYYEWFNNIRHACELHRSRLEMQPIQTADKPTPGMEHPTQAAVEAIDVYSRAHDMLLSRMYSAANKHNNFASHWGTFPELLEGNLSKFYSSLLSRIELSLRTFSREHCDAVEREVASGGAYRNGPAPKRSAPTGAAASASTASNQNKRRKTSASGSGRTATGGGGDDDDDEDDNGADMEDEDEDEDARPDANFAEWDFGTSEGGYFLENGDVDLDRLAEALNMDIRDDGDEDDRSETTSATVEDGHINLSRVGLEEQAARMWKLSHTQMRSVHRAVLSSMLYVPSLDDPGCEETALVFQKACWLLQRRHGARQRLPILLLGYFGLSDAVAERLHMLQIYYNQSLPYNSIGIMIDRLWIDYPRDFALLWRYLQYIRLFAAEQRLLLPLHVATQQRLARQHAVYGSVSTAQRELAKCPEPERTRIVEASESFYYCTSCRGWAHQTCPESATYFAWSEPQQRFVVQRAVHSALGTLVNSAAKLIRPPSRAKAARTAQRVGYSAAAAAASEGFDDAADDQPSFTVAAPPTSSTAKNSYRTDNWKPSLYDFEQQQRICSCDIRRRVTTGMGVRVAHTLLEKTRAHAFLYTPIQQQQQQHSIADPLHTKYRDAWIQYARLAQLFPLRPARVKALNKKFAMYPELAPVASSTNDGDGDDAAATPVMITSVTASSAAAAAVRARGEEEEADGQEFDIAAADEAALDPAVRELLLAYWQDDPRVVNGVTNGVRHADVLRATRPAVASAAQNVTVADSSMICNYPLMPTNLVGLLVSGPTQYPCVWRTYTCCSICGGLMLAFEWRYTTKFGYVCSRHPGFSAIDSNNQTGSYLPRIESGSPLSVTRGASTELQVQQHYYVTEARQLYGIPNAWLASYEYSHLDEALFGLTPAPKETPDWKPGPPPVLCDHCEQERTETTDERPWDHAVRVYTISGDPGKLESLALCSRHYNRAMKRVAGRRTTSHRFR